LQLILWYFSAYQLMLSIELNDEKCDAIPPEAGPRKAKFG